VQVNIAIMRAFIKLREMPGVNLEVAQGFGAGAGQISSLGNVYCGREATTEISQTRSVW